MKRLLLFPYHPDVELLAQKAAEIKGYSILGVHSFQEDILAVKAVNEKLGCNGSFVEMLHKCDALLLLDDYRESKMDKYYEVIQSAINIGKQVFITPLAAQKLDLAAYQGFYTILRNAPKSDLAKIIKEPMQGRVKYIIESPIIAVFGMGKSCCNFENQILIKSMLAQEGYRFAWISSNTLGALYGGYTMPDFLYDNYLAFEEKVIRFNQFVYQISVVEKPDVIVIGVPEGISEFSAHEYNHFAEYPLVVGSAVSVDSAVLCTYFLPKLDVDGMKRTLFHYRERFGFPVHMVSVGRTTFERMREFQQIAYLFLEEEYLQKHYESAENQPDVFVGVWETKKIEDAIQKVFDRLRGNQDAI